MGANEGAVEHVEDDSRKLSMANAKGDRALALIGDERVHLTDEDVSRVIAVYVSR